MFIRLFSDLHLDRGDYNIVPLDNDSESVLVLAGDLHEGTKAEDFILRGCDQFKHVIYVLGNHEFYREEYYKTIAAWKNIAHDIENLYFLHDEAVVLDGVRFLGTTMWTSMNNEDWFTMQAAKDGMNDYHCCKINIDGSYRKLRPSDTVTMHRHAQGFLRREFDKGFDGKTVVITHHTPSLSLSEGRHIGQPLTYSFHASCESIIDDYEPALWLYGHTHHAMDRMLGNTRVMSNQRGYVGYENAAEIGFNPEFLVEI